MSMDVPQPSQSDAVISQPDAEMSDASIEDSELALGSFFDIIVMLIATFILIEAPALWFSTGPYSSSSC